MKSAYNFYNRHIAGLSPETALGQRFPLRGKSPFGDGSIEISEKGDFVCRATGLKGDAIFFLQELYPLLTTKGAEKAIEVESDETSELDPALITDRLKAFREDEIAVASLRDQSGVSAGLLRKIPVWADHDGKSLNAVQFSKSGNPICVIQWQLDDRHESLTGIPRLDPEPSASKIWFVENPLEAYALRLKLNEPVYIRPNHEYLDYGDYQKLTADKHVVLLRHYEHGNWEYSSFPLLEKLLQWDSKCQSITIEHLTGGESLLSWITSDENKKKLLAKADGSQTDQPHYDRDTYHEFIAKTGTQPMFSPQDYQGDRYWYKINDGSFVHSNPINICSQKELHDNFGIKADGGANDQIRLSRESILNIDVSVGQLLPRNTFIQLKRFISDYIYFEHRELASLLALWIMGGYVYRLFTAYAYLHLKGDKGTGKTTLLELIALAGFNGLLESQSTRASITDQVDKLGCTLCLDEFESSSLGTGDDYTQMLKGGYKKGGSYSKKSGNKSVRLETYSPKVLASIDPIGDEALKSRTIPMTTTLVPKSKPVNLWNPDNSLVQRRADIIRNGCYALGLYHHIDIARLYNRVPMNIELPSEGILNSRKREVVAPLIAIAQLVDTGHHPQAETELMQAIEIAWDAEHAAQATNEKLLSDILSKWNHEADFKQYKTKDYITWIDNGCWSKSSLSNHLGGKSNVLNWLSQLAGVKKQTIYINKEFGTKSCTGFPENLKINGKPFRDWFSR
ncbi:hypothetical protein [Natronogracilivirga saccharolytica]|uniref:Uncharacterized protein n=1 Tax=Natronogracilivirga saccharolytica TaxID=2812953 RepID=A0A8J7RLE6_9BACT|nr:hypothetical protein [Natronogracilivirga saccharolytica]MBP3192990.1 hypothetical protein [Natronogracilivirga saccharolytica]